MLKSKKKAHDDTESDLEANIAALKKAIAALEKGTYGAGFLQTGEASVLRKLSITATLSGEDRSMLAAFLSGGSVSQQEYTPQSQEIIGILKQMLDEMIADLKDEEDAEAYEASSYKEVYTINMKRITTLSAMIEAKLKRIGELGVQIAMLKNDLEDTIEGLADNKKFLADLDKNCELKKQQWALYQKSMAEELKALADVIAILNNDDALELFKKTLPSAASLLQMKVSSEVIRRRALAALASAPRHDKRIDFLVMALHGKKIGLDGIIKMIDDLIAVLAKDQADDDAKKEYCTAELDKSDDSKKALDHTIADLETAIADAEETIATLKTEIEALDDGIRALDKEVAESTETRKEEHEAFVADLAANTAALDLLKFAQNRLNKLYNPKLYKPPPKRELTEAERITVNNGGTLAPTEAPGGIGGTGITVLTQEAPAPPPEVDLTYNKNSGGNNAITEMMNMLMGDLEKTITEMKTNEKDAQEDYETFIADSADKRAEDSKAITDKEGSLAELEGELLSNQEALKAKKYELMDVEKYIMELHKECDWIMKNYDLRKSARAGEVDSLKNAKATLSGADFGL
jgi:septal ring factor EnvC (AmiA/AmiB activator)